MTKLGTGTAAAYALHMRRSQPRAGKFKGIGRFGKEIEHVLHAGINLWKELDFGQAPAQVSRDMLACGVRPTPKAPVSNVRRPAGGLEQGLSKLNVDV